MIMVVVTDDSGVLINPVRTFDLFIMKNEAPIFRCFVFYCGNTECESVTLCSQADALLAKFCVPMVRVTVVKYE